MHTPSGSFHAIQTVGQLHSARVCLLPSCLDSSADTGIACRRLTRASPGSANKPGFNRRSKPGRRGLRQGADK